MLPDNWLRKTIRNPTQVPRYLWNWNLRPRILARHANRWYHRGFGRYECNPDGIDLLAQDWDQCLLLDACRYDMFAEQYKQHDLDGTLSSIESRASSTDELFRSALAGKHYDTVYVTANPMFARYREESDVAFHAEIHVWKENGWDQTYHTVLPETTAEYTRKALYRYPSKRLLVHFMQPHYPFLTEGTDFDKSIPDPTEAVQNFWGSLWRTDLDLEPDDIWPLYRMNLAAVLPVVTDLLEELPGKTVVTSDHGNHVGERASPIPIREWGHPQGIYTKQLIEVPWFVSENGSRKSTTADEPKELDDHDRNTVEDRLDALGYR